MSKIAAGNVAARLYRRYLLRHFPYSMEERRHDFLFIHVPKTGGTAIRAALGCAKTGRQHLPWYVYHSADPCFFSRSFKFAIVRNPWDRVVSAYSYLMQGGNGTGDLELANEISEYENFSDFVLNGLGSGAFRSNLMFLPQSNFLIDGENDLKVDFVGRFENLSGAFHAISENLSFETLPISYVNRSSRSRDYRIYYVKKEVIEVVEELYRQDIAVFGYNFEGYGK